MFQIGISRITAMTTLTLTVCVTAQSIPGRSTGAPTTPVDQDEEENSMVQVDSAKEDPPTQPKALHTRDPLLGHFIREDLDSEDIEKVAAAESLQTTLEEFLNSENHRWYLNKMDPEEQRPRQQQTEEFQERYGDQPSRSQGLSLRDTVTREAAFSAQPFQCDNYS
jgi:hypothetical protein